MRAMGRDTNGMRGDGISEGERIEAAAKVRLTMIVFAKAMR